MPGQRFSVRESIKIRDQETLSVKHDFDPFLFCPPVTAIYPMLLLYVLLAKITFYVLGGCADFLQDF